MSTGSYDRLSDTELDAIMEEHGPDASGHCKAPEHLIRTAGPCKILRLAAELWALRTLMQQTERRRRN